MQLPFSERLKSIPVLRILPWFCAGIIPGSFNGTGSDYMTISLGLIFCLIFFLYYLRIISRIHDSWIRGILTACFFFLSGYLLIIPHREVPDIPRGHFWTGEISSYPVEKPNSYLVKIRLLSSVSPEVFFRKTIFLQAYFTKDKQSEVLEPGDRIFFRGSLYRIRNRGNPGEFDYAGWLKKEKIFYRCYVGKSDSWTSWTDKPARRKYLPLILRRKLVRTIYSRSAPEREKSVISAICLGDRNNLDPGTKKAFANAGAIHVMAVSGLHVGMIWMFLFYLLKFTGKNHSLRITRFFLSVAVLWYYAFMTGLSSSVTRSCLMFTLVGFASVLRRQTSTMNTVFVAAFIQLLLNPVSLSGTGFQFSYAAVISILLFYDRIYSLIEVKFPVIKWFSSLAAVSLAAQILTFPLTIYYFHQFPVWFLLTNMMVIPLVTCIMMLFLFSCVFYPVVPIRNLLLDVSLEVTAWLDESVNLVDSLPWAVIENISLNPSQLVLLLLLPLACLLYANYKKTRILLWIQLLFMVFLASGIVDHLLKKNRNELIVYNLYSGNAVGLKYSGRHYIFILENEMAVIEELKRVSSSYWISQHYPAPEFVRMNNLNNRKVRGDVHLYGLPGEGNYLLEFGNFRMGLITSGPGGNLITTRKLRTDLLLICSDDRTGAQEFLNYFRFERLVVSSGRAYRASPAAAKENKTWDIERSGAFVMRVEERKEK